MPLDRTSLDQPAGRGTRRWSRPRLQREAEQNFKGILRDGSRSPRTPRTRPRRLRPAPGTSLARAQHLGPTASFPCFDCLHPFYGPVLCLAKSRLHTTARCQSSAWYIICQQLWKNTGGAQRNCRKSLVLVINAVGVQGGAHASVCMCVCTAGSAKARGIPSTPCARADAREPCDPPSRSGSHGASAARGSAVLSPRSTGFAAPPAELRSLAPAPRWRKGAAGML